MARIIGLPYMIILFFSVYGIDCKESLNKKYDYVIVGSGSAGAVVANRLSEDPYNEVLLLEAGSLPNLVSEIPDLSGTLQRTKYDWAYKTVPQKNSCWGLNEQRSSWPRGKVLGGTSSINGVVYVRGNKRDYDLWAQNGATGWSYEEVLPYFKKSENCRISSLNNDAYHGFEGELTVENPRFEESLADTYLKAGEELDYPTGDCNGASQRVFSIPPLTTRDGRRCSTAKAFLDSVTGRKNLQVLTSAFVKKINFDKDRRVTEVVFDYGEETKKVKVGKEVILSGGSVNSPQLLMLSGIGPKEHLEELGIPVISNLPVGKNLQDHVSTLAMIFSLDKSHRMKAFNTDDAIYYLKEQKGVLATPMGIETIGFVNTKYNEILDWPDIELIIMSVSLASEGNILFKQKVGVNDQVYKEYALPYINNATINCFPMLQRPKSTGEIKLKSKDPYEYPIIDPKYFSHPDDLKVLIEGMKICLDLASTTVMKEKGAKPLDTVIPGCEQYEKLSDDYLACAAQTMTFTVYHPIGTCKMGSASDKTAVVDPTLKVKGVKGLRVADASVMPTMISGHTNAPSIMIGEKAADLILKDHKYRSKKEL